MINTHGSVLQFFVDYFSFMCVLNLIDGMPGPLLEFYCFLLHYFCLDILSCRDSLFGFDFSHDWIQFLLLLLFKLDFFMTLLIGLNAGSLSLDAVCFERSSNQSFIMFIRRKQKYHNSIQFCPICLWKCDRPLSLQICTAPWSSTNLCQQIWLWCGY